MDDMSLEAPVKKPSMEKQRLVHKTSLIVTGLVGLILSGSLALFVWSKQESGWQQRFDMGVLRRQHAVENALQGTVLALDHVGRFVESSEHVTDDEFRYYNIPMLGLFHGLSWIQPALTASGRTLAALPVAAAQAERWHDIASGCTPVDPAWRYPVTLMSARQPIAAAMGLDLRCDPVRVAAMQLARDEGRVVVTSQVQRLMRSGRSMVLFRPVYERGELRTQADRRQALRGFIAAGISMNELLMAPLHALEDGGIYSVTLLDADTAGSDALLLDINPEIAEPQATARTLDIDFAGRTVRVVIRPARAFWAQRHDQLPLLACLAGICFTLLLMAWLNSQDKRRLQAEMLAIARNDDLIDREARLAALFQNSPIAILRCNEQGQIVDANPATGRMLACNEVALKGRNYITLFSPWAAQTFRQRWQEPSWLELELIGPDGEPIPVLARTLSMRQPNGSPYAWTMLEDLRAIRHSERLKREFVATVSHELRTPLTAIKGAIELIQTGAMGECPSEVGMLLEMAAQNAESLNQLINDLLDVERLELGKLSLRTRAQELLPLLAQAQLLAQPLLNEKRLDWNLQVLAGPVRVKVDADRLIQVFKNLFSNAVKFSPFNAGIDITVLCHEGQVEIRVRDHGMGIPENFMPRLFQPFTQADGSDHRSLGGSGLGLAISRGLVERMGGHIRAESVYGQGATFIIELPCVDAVECEAMGEEGDHVAA